MKIVHPIVLRDAILGHLPGQCVTAVDHDLRYVYAAGRLLDVFEMSPAQIVGRTVAEVIGPPRSDQLVHSYQLALAGNELTEPDREFRDVHLEQVFFPIYVYGEGSAVVGAASIVRDVSHRVNGARHLERLATTDALTGLANLRAFEAKASRGLRSCTSLLVLDVDHFKQINDTKGHAAGDAALKAIADVLTACTRPQDTVARTGGDEFSILLADTEPTEAFSVAIRIRLAVSTTLGDVSVSVGAATYPEDGADCVSLRAVADARMYEAKRSRR